MVIKSPMHVKVKYRCTKRNLVYMNELVAEHVWLWIALVESTPSFNIITSRCSAHYDRRFDAVAGTVEQKVETSSRVSWCILTRHEPYPHRPLNQLKWLEQRIKLFDFGRLSFLKHDWTLYSEVYQSGLNLPLGSVWHHKKIARASDVYTLESTRCTIQLLRKGAGDLRYDVM